MNQQSYRRRREEGFTLIELLVVIVILGILSAIVVFSVQGITDRGEGAACEASAQTVRVAAQAHYAQNGNYAADLAALETAGFISEYPVAPAGNVLTVNGGTITYVPADGSVTDTCAAGSGGGGGGATTTTAGGGGGGGTTTTSTTTTTAPPAPCTYVNYTPTSVSVSGGGGNIASNTAIQVNLSGNCSGLTSVISFVDRDDDNNYDTSGGDTEQLSLTAVSGSNNLQWRATLPTFGWNDNETIAVRFTFAGTGAPATVNTTMTTT